MIEDRQTAYFSKIHCISESTKRNTGLVSLNIQTVNVADERKEKITQKIKEFEKSIEKILAE